ncbi:hypothetical protein AMBLS11_07810 [Alteromonas macleodii str. 'Black Sea 11']|nr:hypothetical protein AMBLS11_07810 [Alteromonas macleodii str. 'Black Sea 11']
MVGGNLLGGSLQGENLLGKHVIGEKAGVNDLLSISCNAASPPAFLIILLALKNFTPISSVTAPLPTVQHIDCEWLCLKLSQLKNSHYYPLETDISAANLSS